jgi:hypothetical protein
MFRKNQKLLRNLARMEKKVFKACSMAGKPEDIIRMGRDCSGSSVSTFPRS